MIRTDRHRHLHSCNHVSQRTPAASPSNVIRMSAQNASDFCSPQNFIRSSEPISEHKKCHQSNTNPMIHGVLQAPSQRWEGLRPGPAACGTVPEAQNLPDHGRKYTVGFKNSFAERSLSGVLGSGDSRLPSSVLTRGSLPEIAGLTTYVV
jgi:hypothetical protein